MHQSISQFVLFSSHRQSLWLTFLSLVSISRIRQLELEDYCYDTENVIINKCDRNRMQLPVNLLGCRLLGGDWCLYDLLNILILNWYGSRWFDFVMDLIRFQRLSVQCDRVLLYGLLLGLHLLDIGLLNDLRFVRFVNILQRNRENRFVELRAMNTSVSGLILLIYLNANGLDNTTQEIGWGIGILLYWCFRQRGLANGQWYACLHHGRGGRVRYRFDQLRWGRWWLFSRYILDIDLNNFNTFRSKTYRQQFCVQTINSFEQKRIETTEKQQKNEQRKRIQTFSPFLNFDELRQLSSIDWAFTHDSRNL